jgi:hypothetical protein
MRKMLLFAAAAAASLVVAGGAAADERPVTVMTQNIYQGTELEHVLAATDFTALVLGVATDYNNVIATKFPERAGALAAEIVRARPAPSGSKGSRRGGRGFRPIRLGPRSPRRPSRTTSS